MPKVIVGLGGLLSDPACCVLANGQIVSAVEQLKLTRHHRPGDFPDEAFASALAIAGVSPEQVDGVAIARPFAAGTESHSLLMLRAKFAASEAIVVEHHDAHAASAYYASGFNQAHVLSVDRAGDFRSAVLYHGEGNRMTRVRELYYPDSLGDLYNRVTELLGFEARSDEHKVQWLSAQGSARFVSLFREIVRSGENGWPKFDRSFFDADTLGRGGFSSRFYEAIGCCASDEIPEQTRADLASSLQAVIEEAVAGMLGETDNVAIAGGLALNALLVRSLEHKFPRVFVQPASGNAGTALGAALHAWHNFYGSAEAVPFQSLCLGPAFSLEQVKQVLENCKLRFQFLLTGDQLIQKAVAALSDNKIVAWMQGRMEFGPRALGNRSILASPLNPYSTENLNVFIKHREPFRKFAASVPEEMAERYFRVGSNARFLATVGEVRPEFAAQFSAATLGANLIRVQTVSRSDNPLYHALLVASGEATGLPVLYNTSFNLFGDPLVCTPRDAVRSFYSSGIDALFAENFYMEK